MKSYFNSRIHMQGIYIGKCSLGENNKYVLWFSINWIDYFLINYMRFRKCSGVLCGDNDVDVRCDLWRTPVFTTSSCHSRDGGEMEASQPATFYYLIDRAVIFLISSHTLTDRDVCNKKPWEMMVIVFGTRVTPHFSHQAEIVITKSDHHRTHFIPHLLPLT